MSKADNLNINATQRLTEYLARLEYQALPEAVIAKTKALFIDWVACVLASKHEPIVTKFADFATLMGPASGCIAQRFGIPPWRSRVCCCIGRGRRLKCFWSSLYGCGCRGL